MPEPSQPFITFYTPTYGRPIALAQCLASVARQTLVAEIEQIVIPDHVGLGVGGMFQRVPSHAHMPTGRYVHFLADDDVLAGPGAVAALKAVVEKHQQPEAVLVRVRKGQTHLPGPHAWPPVCGQIDLGCMVVRRDIWAAHAAAGGYGHRYEGDFDFAASLHAAGVEPVLADLFFMHGGVSHGKAELVAGLAHQ